MSENRESASAYRALQTRDARLDGRLFVGVTSTGIYTPEDLLQRAEPWRPWRAYAVQHLWAADAVRSQRAREARHG